MSRRATSGNLVLMAATSAAYTCVKVGEAICAFIMALTSNPRPRIRFSLNSSITMFEMFETLTLFTIPLIDLRKTSHIYF